MTTTFRDRTATVQPNGRVHVSYVTPGWDCMNKPCEHAPTGRHGIHADTWIYVVRDPVKNAALSLEVDSGIYPASADMPPRSAEGVDLTLHVPFPVSDEAVAAGAKPQRCEHVEGGCYMGWTSSLTAEDFWRVYGAHATFTQSPSFWRMLEERFDRLYDRVNAAPKRTRCTHCDGTGIVTR